MRALWRKRVGSGAGSDTVSLRTWKIATNSQTIRPQHRPSVTLAGDNTGVSRMTAAAIAHSKLVPSKTARVTTSTRAKRNEAASHERVRGDIGRTFDQGQRD